MILLNKTPEPFGTFFEHAAVLKMKDGSYKTLHIQDGIDNLDEEDYEAGYTWYLDYEIKDFKTKPSKEERNFEDEGYDGGMLLCKEDYIITHSTWESVISDIIDMEDIKLEDVESIEMYYWER